MTDKYNLTKQVIDEALDAALAVIQNHIGQTDGGRASIYFSGNENRAPFADVMQAYADHEKSLARTYMTEFPHFAEEDVPAMPAGFVDESWHNDACPSFINDALGVELWVAEKDAGARDMPDRELKRFTLVNTEGNGHDLILTTDDWNAVLHKIADLESELARQVQA